MGDESGGNEGDMAVRGDPDMRAEGDTAPKTEGGHGHERGQA